MSDKPKEWTVEVSDVVLNQMAEDPDAAEMIRDFNSRLRQALEGIDQNDPEELERVLRSLGMEPFDPDLDTNPITEP